MFYAATCPPLSASTKTIRRDSKLVFEYLPFINFCEEAKSIVSTGASGRKREVNRLSISSFTPSALRASPSNSNNPASASQLFEVTRSWQWRCAWWPPLFHYPGPWIQLWPMERISSDDNDDGARLLAQTITETLPALCRSISVELLPSGAKPSDHGNRLVDGDGGQGQLDLGARVWS